jgi:predicted GIY-YIG superfamily endonuclease
MLVGHRPAPRQGDIRQTMRVPKRFYVYIMTNSQRSHTLYVGITGGLIHRVWQHKNKLIPGFTSRYNLF